jgi:hypothetical protein
MTWYAAHIISYIRFLDGVQDKYPIYENVVLLEADSTDQAYEEAKRIGKEDYDDTTDGSEGLFWEERPAVWVFAGVRKLIECQDTASTMTEQPDRIGNSPIHGTEVTYSQMELADEEALTKLIKGDPVTLLYEE